MFSSQFEPAEKDLILRINIGTSFGFKFLILKFSKDKVRLHTACASPLCQLRLAIWPYIYIHSHNTEPVNCPSNMLLRLLLEAMGLQRAP